MTRYMLDTNTVSLFLRGNANVTAKITSVPMVSLFISAITEAELHYGLFKRPEAKRLQLAVSEFLLRIDVLPWDSAAANIYGQTRATLESQGKTMASFDLMIASHAISQECVCVTNDQSFQHLVGLQLEDWTKP